jgi:hypothetical protein
LQIEHWNAVADGRGRIPDFPTVGR